jgi:uncharacterized Zn finger protein
MAFRAVMNCEHCDKSFDTKENLKRHIKGCHADNVITCENCGSTYQSMAYFVRHCEYLRRKLSSGS